MSAVVVRADDLERVVVGKPCVAVTCALGNGALPDVGDVVVGTEDGGVCKVIGLSIGRHFSFVLALFIAGKATIEAHAVLEKERARRGFVAADERVGTVGALRHPHLIARLSLVDGSLQVAHGVLPRRAVARRTLLDIVYVGHHGHCSGHHCHCHNSFLHRVLKLSRGSRHLDNLDILVPLGYK